ncbi:hypothetical protein LOK49_LG11G01009 [Camellia lanceoleosa]|uniref:Uncharacterized protein n=1 Tax=Camellia lanceoleosa TaxID=1840588 RepID=A0ACC0G253_9ERIC|nr:hypothetical protein LOK49_LG11G01009 [Camellia lanceoleosa]
MIGLLRRSFLAIHQDPSVYQNPNEYMGMAGQRRSLGENGSNPTMAVAATAAGDQQLQQTANVSEKEKERETSIASNDIGNGSGKESPHLHEESDLPESLEHNVPDSPFASPKAAVDFFDDNTATEVSCCFSAHGSSTPPQHPPPSHSAVAANKCMNLLLQPQQSDNPKERFGKGFVDLAAAVDRCYSILCR